MAKHRSTGALPPSRLRERRRKARTLTWLFFVMAFLILIGVLVGLAHVKRIRVTEVAISETKTVSAAGVEAAVRKELTGLLWFVLPRDNVLIYSQKNIEGRVLREYPAIKSVTVSLKNFHAIEVKVVERIPVALWCGQAMSTDSSNPCFFLDESGFIYELAPEYSGDAYVRWYGETSLPNPPAQYIRTDVFRALVSLLAQLNIEAGEPRQVIQDVTGDVRVSFAEGFDLLFTLMQKTDEVLANLRAAKSSDVLQGKQLSGLQYLDLRFGNKMYYKFK